MSASISASCSKHLPDHRGPSGSHLARRRRGGARRDAAGLPVRLSQPQPLARALQPRRPSSGWCSSPPSSASRSSIRRSPPASRASRIAAVAGVGFVLVVYLATHGYDRAIMLIPTWVLLLVWVVGGGLHRHRAAHQRPRAAGADRRARADRDADRLHGDAARLRRRRLRAGLVSRHRAQGAGARPAPATSCSTGTSPADRVFVGPEVEQQLGLKRGALEGPAADWLELLHPFDRDRYRAALDAVHRAAARPHRPGFPPARRRRALLLVPPEGAAGGRLRRRGHPHRRHARRRHRGEDRGGAAAARRRARQSDRACPTASCSSTGSTRRSPSRSQDERHPADGHRRSTSTGSSRSTMRSASRPAIRSCSRCRAASAGC